MLVKYKKQANIYAGIWLVTLIAFLAAPLPSGNIWKKGDATLYFLWGSLWGLGRPYEGPESRGKTISPLKFC